MKIGYDAKRAFHNKTGLGNYSRSLIDGMLRVFPDNHYYLFNTKPSEIYQPEGLHLHKILPRNFLSKRLPALWRSLNINSIVFKKQLDIYHGLSHELPFGKKKGTTKWVLTVHDLIFLRFPAYFPFIDRLLYKKKMQRACKKADCIIAISQQTKRDLMQFMHVPEEKITVIYQDCHEQFKRSVSKHQKERIKTKYQLPDYFVLQVGTIETRKNLLLTVKAMKAIPEEIKLVVVGKATDYLNEVKAEILKLNLQHRVSILSGVPFEDLPTIYQLARIFVYPSRFEGFGIPIIEALHSGVPVIAATGSCLEEAGGPDSVYIHPDCADELADAIVKLSADDDARQVQIARGLDYVKQFDQQVLTHQLVKLYQKLQ